MPNFERGLIPSIRAKVIREVPSLTYEARVLKSTRRTPHADPPPNTTPRPHAPLPALPLALTDS